MKIFYAGTRYEYYDVKRGDSFEHTNFYGSLTRMQNIDVTYVPFDRIIEVGKKQFNEELLEAVKKERPDMLFVFMFADELEPHILEELKRYTKTVAWFADDSWRFYNYSKFWAPRFTWAITTYSYMPILYKKAGQPNVIRSQWAADLATFHPLPWSQGNDVNSVPEVSFVGGWTPAREDMLKKLKAQAISLQAFGNGWSGGRVDNEALIKIFSNSKINLGLNPPPQHFTINSLGRLLGRRSVPGTFNFIAKYLKFSSAVGYAFDFHLASNIQSFMHRGVSQIKARHFEIPATGGLMMTAPADDLEIFYNVGKEIIVYNSMKDMTEKIRYYLAHDAERIAIARAGYERTIREHTYDQRFEEIFRVMGLR